MKKTYEKICSLESAVEKIQTKLDNCSPDEQDKLQNELNIKTKEFIGKVQKIFAESPLNEETFFKIKTLYEEVGNTNNKLEWLYSMQLYLGFEDMDENENEISENPFSDGAIDAIPELAEANQTTNPREQLDITNKIAEMLRDRTSAALRKIDAIFSADSAK